MGYEHSLQRYRDWYAKLLRLYPKSYHDRFGESMEQTFNDLCRERAEGERGLLGRALWLFVETSGGIVRENMASATSQNRNIIRIALGTALILLVPLVAMQFSDEVDWSPFDFIVAGALLFGSGFTYELIARRARNLTYRIAIGVAVLAALLLVWVNLAVGIVGSEDNPVNVLYMGVLAVGIIGATAARLAPRGMANTLFAMAAAQVLIGAIAIAFGWGAPEDNAWQIVGVSGFFVTLFVVPALLFRHAAREQSRGSE
jgi:hypothetical protein